MNNRQKILRKDIGNDTYTRTIAEDKFSRNSTQTFQIMTGEVLLAQPEPIFKQTAVTVQLTKGGMVTSVPYPGAFLSPISGSLHGTYEGPIPGQMVTLGFIEGNSAAPFVINRYPYQGVANTFTELQYINPMTLHQYDTTDVMIGHFSGSIIRFNTGLISGKLPGSITVDAVTDLELNGLNVSVSSGVNTDISSTIGNVSIQSGALVQIASATKSMKDLIDSLIDAIVAIKTVGSPTNHVLDPSTILALDAEKAKWELLLEA